MRKANYFTPSELAMFQEQVPIFNPQQMKIINRKTPDSEIEIKTDKNGFKYKSVKAAYVKALVSLVTGANFDFEIKSREFISSTKETIVEGRLTIKNDFGSVSREQIGQHYLNTKTTSEGNRTSTYPADIGNGFKAAASDCFKKCASEFGFCWDIYGQEHSDKKKEEQPEAGHVETKKLERLVHFLEQGKTPEEIEATYETYIETSKESDQSKKLLEIHMKRVLKNK